MAARLAHRFRPVARELAAALANRASRVHRLGAFGPGSVIRPPFRVTCPERVSIGANVYIGPTALLSLVSELNGHHYEPSLSIGDRTSFGDGLYIAAVGHIEIGCDIQVGRHVYIGDTYHEFQDPTVPTMYQPLAPPRPVVIGNGSHLGIGCMILPGVTLGENAYVGAAAVVTKDVPARSVVVGNPARVIRQFDGSQWRSTT